ncbi:MAG: radical SAM protein [Chloroflexi bacterium]|nr:radical SAM protein [Chloroflexota bacterium]
MEQPRDYVFRYPLRPAAVGDREPVADMVRGTLAQLLDLVAPTYQGQDVKLEGFRFLGGDRGCYSLPAGGREAVQSPETRNLSLYEPRLDFVRCQLEAMLSLVELESGGQPVAVDGFRVRDPGQWLSPSAGDPFEVYGYGAEACDCDCVFCYHKGNPPDLALPTRRRPTSEAFQEMVTRMRYFNPRAGTALFPSLGTQWEALASPYSLPVLRLLRERTDRPLRIYTNGEKLSPRAIEELAALKPLYVYLSLNSASPERRQRLMGGRHPEVAVGAPSLLQEAGIPFAAVVVPWPVDGQATMLDDLEATVSYAEAHRAHLVQVNLPGFSRYFSETPPFDTSEVWLAIVERVQTIRRICATPVVAMPTLYEEGLTPGRKNLPVVVGLVAGSPAALGGLRQGDMITHVNALPVRDRPQARDLLTVVAHSGAASALLTVARGGCTTDLRLDLSRWYYPYSPEMDHHLGVVMLGQGFRTRYLEDLRDIARAQGARRVLLLSSRLVKPLVEQALPEAPGLGGIEIELGVPPNRYLGGNIMLGDLLVVQDFIDYLKEYLAGDGPRPDLVVIPSSPFGLGSWGRDLTGRVWLDIEREVGLPVALLPCETVYD